MNKTENKLMETINIQIPAIAENIRMIESFIDNSKDRFHLDEDLYGNIMIAVTEAVNNAIKHGCKSNSDKSVSISLSLTESAIKFRVEDDGVGFDYRNLPDPTAPENIEKPSGRGIFLMKHLSDEVDFSDKGRVVELSLYENH
jgi:serine/threonine-protein kinase RsbW